MKQVTNEEMKGGSPSAGEVFVGKRCALSFSAVLVREESILTEKFG